MNGITRTLFLGLGALGAALILSTPATAKESAGARHGHHGYAHVGGHRGHGHPARSVFRGPGIHPGLHKHRPHMQRVHHGSHHRQGHRHWRAHHWRRHHWQGHRPYWRTYRPHPRYGHH